MSRFIDHRKKFNLRVSMWKGIWNLIFLQHNFMCTVYNITKSYSRRTPLRWRHNERDGVSNHQPHDCLLSRLFRRRSKKTLKLRVTGLCEGNSSVTGEFPTQRARNAENVSIWWHHHAFVCCVKTHTFTKHPCVRRKTPGPLFHIH